MSLKKKIVWTVVFGILAIFGFVAFVFFLNEFIILLTRLHNFGWYDYNSQVKEILLYICFVFFAGSSSVVDFIFFFKILHIVPYNK